MVWKWKIKLANFRPAGESDWGGKADPAALIRASDAAADAAWIDCDCDGVHGRTGEGTKCPQLFTDAD